MKPQGGKPVGQVVRQQATQAVSDLGKGAADEARNIVNTAATQVTGSDASPLARAEQAPSMGVGQSAPNVPNPNGFSDSDQYRQNLAQETQKRMKELKAIIDQEGQKARMQREQEERQWQQAQEEAMKKDELKRQEEEEKGGLLASLGKAAKRVKGRLGQIKGQGKGEKGKAAKG